ncbi:hypothetical protein [Saccharopolyspora phatthalungensis]|uniref:Uncharacterized protein n=1 Tax=Saccharopolyspora phatthalungensis TaxID=664693 RepID=A0A840QIK8_9PSEU|nr:hypothetical protein [Saccharopolyspora phatthalungensis]MBB5159980.1 hypothetical protein [Saccharopolyspora phatthalungensis]
MSPETSVVERDDLHQLLLHLAGRVPDDGLAAVRTCLADGEQDQVAGFLAAAVGTGRLALTQDEADLIEAVAVEQGENISGLDKAPRLAELPPSAFEFTALDQEAMDHQDATVVEAASRVGGLRGLWRVIRSSAARDVRVYLGETEQTADVVELVAEVQHSLAEAGTEPRIEMFAEGTELAPYHEAALETAELVWTAEPPPRIHLARVFDGADPAQGPYFEPDHPRLRGADSERVLAFLRSGEVVLSNDGMMDDVVRSDQVGTVPVNFRSDGTWIWTDSITYYLDRYHLSPEPDLVEHALAATGPTPPLSRIAFHQVLAELFAPAPQEPMWQAS